MSNTSSGTLESQRKKAIYRITIIGSIGNAILLAVKFFAGIVGHSSAMVADAVHSLSDFFTDLVVLVFVRISGKPKDHDHNYGHGKFETLATSIIGLSLLVVGAGICWNGLEQIWKVIHGATLEEPGSIAFYMAIVSIAVKELMYWWTKAVGERTKSKAVVANAWHHRSDAFSSIATATGIGGAIFLGEKWRVLDPLAAVLVSVFIIKISLQFIRSSMDELLEKSLPPEIEKQILDIIAQFPEAQDPHNLRTRCIGSSFAIEVHIRFDKNMSVERAHQVATSIEEKIREEFGANTYVSTHIEPLK